MRNVIPNNFRPRRRRGDLLLGKSYAAVTGDGAVKRERRGEERAI